MQSLPKHAYCMHTMQITSKATVLLRHKEKHKYKHQCGKRRSSYAPSIQHTHTVRDSRRASLWFR